MNKKLFVMVAAAFCACDSPQQTKTTDALTDTSQSPLAIPTGMRELPQNEADSMIKNATRGRLTDVKGAYAKFDTEALNYFRTRSGLQNVAIVLGGVEYEDSALKKKKWYPALLLRFELQKSSQTTAPEYIYFISDRVCPPPTSSSCDN